jgi:AcrR family transcriptional regulator
MTRSRQIKSRKSPTQARSLFTVNQILEAAAQVFTESGYAGTTTNHIAKRAGVSIGSLYQYFPNKDAILVSLVRMHLKEADERLMSLVSMHDLASIDLRDLLRMFLKATLELHTENPRLQTIILSEVFWSSEAMQELHRIEDEAAQKVVALIEAHPQIQVPNSQLAAYFIVHIVKDLAHEFVIHPPEALSEAAFVEEMVRLLEKYLST